MDRRKQIIWGLSIAAAASTAIYFSFFFSPLISPGKATD